MDSEKSQIDDEEEYYEDFETDSSIVDKGKKQYFGKHQLDEGY